MFNQLLKKTAIYFRSHIILNKLVPISKTVN